MKVFDYYKLAKEELSKVIFPTRQQLKVAFISVVFLVFVVTVFLSLVDFVLSIMVSNIL